MFSWFDLTQAVVDQQTLDSVTPTPTLDSMRPRPITYTIIHTDVCLPHKQTGSKLNVRIIIFHNISLQRLTLDLPWYPLVADGNPQVSHADLHPSPSSQCHEVQPQPWMRTQGIGRLREESRNITGLGLSTNIHRLDQIEANLRSTTLIVSCRVSLFRLDQSIYKSIEIMHI